MTLKELINLLKKNWMLVLIFALVFTGYGYWREKTKPVNYVGFSTATVYQQKDESKQTDFNYDEYYRFSANRYFLDTLAYWLDSPSMIEEIFKEAKIPLPNISAKQYSKVFDSSLPGLGGNALTFSYISKQSAESEKIIQASKNILSQKIQSLKTNHQLPDNLIVEFTDNAVVMEKTKPTLSAIVGLAAGLLLGIIIVLLKESLK